MGNNSKANVDNFWAFLDDVLTPDSQNVKARNKTQQIRATTKTNLGGTVQSVASDVLDLGETIAKETGTTVRGGLTLAGNIDDNASENFKAGMAALGTPGGKALATGVATAVGGPAAGALVNQLAGAFGAPAPATPAAPAPAPAPPTTFPGTPKEDNTGKVLVGVGFLAALGYAFSRRGKNA